MSRLHDLKVSRNARSICAIQGIFDRVVYLDIEWHGENEDVWGVKEVLNG